MPYRRCDRLSVASKQQSQTTCCSFAFSSLAVLSEYQLLPESFAVFTWRDRMLDLHDGYARSASDFELSSADLLELLTRVDTAEADPYLVGLCLMRST